MPAASSMGVRRGLTPARGIIHLHSPYSHDACYGDPRAFDGSLDEECLADLKRALCVTRMDYAVLTEHDDSMADEPFEDLFVIRGDDELIRNAGGDPIAARIACDDGHRVVLYTGGENDQMPIMIDAHPAGSVQQRHDAYDSSDPATMDLWRSLGGLAWHPHTERYEIDTLRATAPDGVEIYNLHANIDPNIRADELGLDGPGAIEAVAEFAGDQSAWGPEPDLALLAFLEPNRPSIEMWQQLIADGLRVRATGGTDAHQNSAPIVMRDGETGDSYRRMIRWLSNVVLVQDPTDHVQIEDAVRAGRMFVAFEVLGTPVGFDFEAGGAVEIGGEAAVGAALTLAMPTVHELPAELPAPAIRGRILRIDTDGTATEVAEGAGPTVTADVTAGAVAYRAEVLMVPHHLGPYLGSLGTAFAEREQVWIYSNPIYVAP